MVASPFVKLGVDNYIGWYYNVDIHTKELVMKRMFVIAVLVSLTACSTIGGAVGGLGKDIKAGTDWVQSKVDPNSTPAK